MKFQDYLIESWKDYKLSKSPKVLLYDFYLLSYISSLILDPGTRKDVGLTGVGYSGKFFGREGKELDLDIQNAQRKLLPFLGTKLSQALFIAITSELRHALDRNQKWSEFKHTKNKTFRNYIRNLELMSNKELKDFHSNRNIEQPELAIDSAGRKISYQAAKKAIKETGGNVVDFARMAGDAFKDLNWSAAFGGPAWAAIAEGYVDLRQALNNYNPEAPSPSSESAEKLIAAIDHAFDLEHNTGTVLNKVNYFEDENGYAWIKQALDDKRDSDMYVIASKASSDMRKLGHEVLKVAGMQDRQLKQVPATAGIPETEKPVLDANKISEGDIVISDAGEYLYQITSKDKSGIVCKVIGVENKSDERYLGKSYDFDYELTQDFKKVNKQEEDNVLKKYTVDPNYKPAKIAQASSDFKVGDKVKVKNEKDTEGIVKAVKKGEAATLVQIEITKSEDFHSVGILAWYHEGNLKKISEDSFDLKVGDTVKFNYKYIYGKILRIANYDNKTFYEVEITKSSDPQVKVGQKITTVAGGVEKEGATQFNVGDKVKFNMIYVKGEGIIEAVKINKNDPYHSYADVKVTKAESGCKRGDIVNSLFAFLQKMDKPIKLQGFAAAYADEPSKEKEWGIGDLVKLKNEYHNIYGNIVMIYDNKKLYDIIITDSNSPTIRVGQTITATYDDFEKPGSSNKPIKLQGFAAAYADEPAPREDENVYSDQRFISVGGYYLINKENILVRIVEINGHSIDYMVIATTKKFKHLEGSLDSDNYDNFHNNIDFKIPPEDVDYYIREFKKKR